MQPASEPRPVLSTDLALPGKRAGKVRDVYDLPRDKAGRERLLIIATDRISAFDVVMPTPIPGKGRLLTELSVFWLGFAEKECGIRTHLLSTDHREVPEEAFAGAATRREDLAGRVMIARKAKVIPIECVARGYLEGSGLKEYKATGAVCGVRLPPGLVQCDRLPEAIFTPATKEEMGRHDENITFERAAGLVGEGLMRELRELTLRLYRRASEHALSRGIIIADTKFEFGFEAGADVSAGAGGAGAGPMLIDEALTPDSSRFWPADGYAPGRAQKSYDKQFLREYLEELVAAGTWDKSAPGPELPARIVEATLEKYREAAHRLSG